MEVETIELEPGGEPLNGCMLVRCTLGGPDEAHWRGLGYVEADAPPPASEVEPDEGENPEPAEESLEELRERYEATTGKDAGRRARKTLLRELEDA